MKIKNESVSIKIGNKNYNFNNLILDVYLEKFVEAQLDKNNLYKDDYIKTLRYCLLKFDNSLEDISPNSIIPNKEFDIYLNWPQAQQNISENQITINYSYSSKMIVDFEDSERKNISQFYGRKITAIGFASSPTSFMPVEAILDTSNYNIYLQENQDLTITRKDIVTTDAIFYTNSKSKIPGPAHLCPYGISNVIHQKKIYKDKTQWILYKSNAYGILHSVGLSSYPDYIDKEFLIEKDVKIELNGTELNVKGIENYITTDNSIYCNENMYCRNNTYPIKTNYKYMVLKYKVYQRVHYGTYDDVKSEIIDTGYYYHQAIPIDKFGKSNLKIKYERG